jgi:SAM-dependent methyltransferase
MAAGPETTETPAAALREAIWHEVECGAYAADLALWDELASAAAGPVLELGAGGGRVALVLAAGGHQVTALDSSPALVAELRRRALAGGYELEVVLADAREFSLERRFAAVLAPMQFVHLLGGAGGRAAMLAAAAAHLEPGGTLAVALLADQGAGASAADATPPLPDVREVDGWVYSSLPIEVRAGADSTEVRRLRQLVSPAGELSEELDLIRLDHLEASSLEREAAAAGFFARERVAVPPTADHVGSIVCVLEAG